MSFKGQLYVYSPEFSLVSLPQVNLTSPQAMLLPSLCMLSEHPVLCAVLITLVFYQ